MYFFLSGLNGRDADNIINNGKELIAALNDNLCIMRSFVFRKSRIRQKTGETHNGIHRGAYLM